MATPKKQSTTKSPVSSMGLTFESGNPDNYPIAYVDNVWDIAAANSQLALKLGNSGQFDQHTINEDLATAARTNAAAIETLNKTDGSAGSVKKIVDDAIAAVVAEAPAAFDTLKEMSDWIAQHVEDASAMNTAIQGKVDKVNGKGLSENDYTDTEKSKLANIEAGAQVNAIEHIKVNNTEQTIADKTVNIVMPTAANEYVYICKNYAGGTSATILAATHGCGATPIVTCWLNNKIVELDVTKNAAGDITIGWNGTTTISAQNPLTICVIGMSVTPDEEQQPAPAVPDASDYPYLTFIKTDDGECEVVAANNFSETSVDIPAAVMLNDEELAVKSIGTYAFRYCRSLTSVTIPNSVELIDYGAFCNCGLHSITIPNSVITIGEDAFVNCSSLASVTIGNGVTTIGTTAFQGCDNLALVSIGNSVTTIGESAFGGCSSLTSITIPNSVTTIENGAFYSTGLTSIIIPNSVTSIGEEAFTACEYLTDVVISNSVTTIGKMAFDGCTALSSVIIPNSVVSVGRYVFRDCSNATIYCMANSKPSGWDSDWNENGGTVVWGYTPPQEESEDTCPECGEPLTNGVCTNNECSQNPNPTLGVEYCPTCNQPLSNGECTNSDCPESPNYVEPEVQENCPECGQPMWDGECTNISCPNSPYYDQGGEVEPIGD